MKKLLLSFLMITLLLTLAAVAKDPTVTMNGWVSDMKCGVKGANAGAAECTKKCLAAGEKMAFVTDIGHKVLLVENPDVLNGREGQHVTVSGHVDVAKPSIYVQNVKMVKE